MCVCVCVCDLGLRPQSFRGKTFVDIREYYTDKGSGQEKPGKKGIALQMDDVRFLIDYTGPASAPNLKLILT